jgi:hypothetical protein
MRIASIGSSGSSFGPQVHFEVRRNGQVLDRFAGPLCQPESFWVPKASARSLRPAVSDYEMCERNANSIARDGSINEKSMKPILCMFVFLLTASTGLAQQPAPRPGTAHPLPPGVYEIRPIHADMCLTVMPDGWPRVPHLSQRPCTRDDSTVFLSEQRHHVIPAPGGGYFIQVNTNSQCATVARGVVFGPASIDVHMCDTSTGEACSANTADQIFRLVFSQAGPGVGANHVGDVYEIRTANNECWDIQSGKSDAGVDAIRWACNGQSNQRFRFRYITSLPHREGLACAARVGW